MEIKQTTLVYFSATRTTKKVAKLIADTVGGNCTEYDITQQQFDKELLLNNQELLIIAMPVYSGRIPATTIDTLKKIKGDGTPAIIVCVYGNRDYDDALLELKELVEENNFKVISAGAFIAQHSIFPKVGTNRPDSADVEQIKAFTLKSEAILKSIADTQSLSEVSVKGNKPYKVPKSIPLHPHASRKCNKCGACAKLCPVQAISEENPQKTNNKVCISCARCIVSCAQNARSFKGILYFLAGKKFTKSYAVRREPDVYFSDSVTANS